MSIKTLGNRNCITCNKSFVITSQRKKQKYCSQECRPMYVARRNVRTIESTCVQCRKNFTYPSTKKMRFCSTQCREKFYKIIQDKESKKRLSEFKPETRICKRPDCNNEFKTTVHTKNKLYCSKDCSLLDMRNRYQNRNQKFKKKCIGCGAIFKTSRENKKFCSQDCSSKNPDKKTQTKIFTFNSTKQKNTNFTNFSELTLYSEHDFEEWFAKNYVLFGLKKLIKIDRMFPDVIAETYSGEIIRIE